MRRRENVRHRVFGRRTDGSGLIERPTNFEDGAPRRAVAFHALQYCEFKLSTTRSRLSDVICVKMLNLYLTRLQLSCNFLRFLEPAGHRHSPLLQKNKRRDRREPATSFRPWQTHQYRGTRSHSGCKGKRITRKVWQKCGVASRLRPPQFISLFVPVPAGPRTPPSTALSIQLPRYRSRGTHSFEDSIQDIINTLQSEQALQRRYR